MKIIRKNFVCLYLVLVLLLVIALPANATELNTDASHATYVDSASAVEREYAKTGYLYDTLTLAGSGIEKQVTYTVLELEHLAYNSELGYQGQYSLLSRGMVFTEPVMTGLLAYDFLVYSGMKDNLPDNTPVRFIAKDGYATSLTLGCLRQTYNRYAGSNINSSCLGSGLPVLISFGSNGLPLIGPTGSEAVYTKFDESDGFVATADNVGGPLRIVIGQSSAGEFNAPSCAKWLAAIVVGDADGYVYTRESDSSYLTDTVPQGGDWTHHGDYSKIGEDTVVISGSEVEPTVLTVAQLEDMKTMRVRDYFAASAGRNVYEGLKLRDLISVYLLDGIENPSSVTAVAGDGYAAELDLKDIADDIVSFYQPGLVRPVLLAYAIDGVPLVTTLEDSLYQGNNANGPLRLVVENTISKWVKDVEQIIVGSPSFNDVDAKHWAAKAIYTLYADGVIGGYPDGGFHPASNVSYGEALKMLLLAGGYEEQSPTGSHWASGYLSRALAEGLLDETVTDLNRPILRQEIAALLVRLLHIPLSDTMQNSPFADYDSPEAAALYETGVMIGSVTAGERYLYPQNKLNRAELATIITRF